MSGGKNISWISTISKADTKDLGTLLANLGEIYTHKFPTPQAFALTPSGVTTILEKNQLTQKIKDKINKTTPENSKDTSQEIQNLILNATYPDDLKSEILEAYDHFNVDLSEIKDAPGALAILKSAREPIFVAVKSSNSQKTLINIKGNPELLESIKKVIASVFSEEEVLKQKEDNTENLQIPSIIIQKMINSNSTGKVYSQNPIENDQSIRVKAVFGQKLTPEIIPDTHTLSRNFEILKETISEKTYAITRTASGQTKTISLTPEESSKRVLKTYEIKQLAELGLKLEELFSCPQEITFAIENGSIFILETKPISDSQNKQTSEGEFSNPVQTKTKINLILDPVLFEKNMEKIHPDEIGIVNLENLIATSKTHPQEYEEKNELENYKNLIQKGLSKITKAFPSSPIWIKIPSLENQNKQEETGIKFSLKHKEIFKTELTAIKELRTEENNLGLGIILPKITCPEEIEETKKLLQELKIPDMPLGITLETPSAAILIKDICKTGINQVSFETKKLAKRTLASANNPDETSWAILKQISRVIRECKSQNVKTSIHSGSATNRKILEFLIKQKIDSISLTPNKIYVCSKIIQELEANSSTESIDNRQRTQEDSNKKQTTENTEESRKENIFS